MKYDGLELRKGKGNTCDVVIDTLMNHSIDSLEEYKIIDMSSVPILNPENLNNIGVVNEK